MVRIEDIRTVRSLVCIRLDTGFSYWLRRDDLVGTSFHAGDEVDEETFLQAVRVRQYPRALNHAVSMLARRPCSCGEIRTRLLTRRYMEDVAGLVVYKLEKENLLNDREFCDQWVRFRTARHFGPAVIRRELRMKGIPPDMIEEALARTEPPDHEDHALVLARKAWARAKSGEDVRKTRQRVIASLVRKGFSWEDARNACDTAENE